SAFGIGYISFNFNTYDYYTLTGGSCAATIGSYPTGTCNLSSQGLAYTIPHEGASTYLVFSVDLTNVDPNQRDLLFDANNYMQSVMICASPAGGSCGSISGASAIWSMGCAQGGVVKPLANCQITENGVTGVPLHYGQATTVYFIEDVLGTPPQITNKWGTNFYAISPIFFLVHGSLACIATSNGCTVGTAQQFGENIPFTSVYFTP
ncbi:MAG TPA: hypothetical protein VFE91_01810, partial [Nitrososphaerales archaeon]|nr:hypothetical protein [Nitrososphaerales archaeon]